MRPNYSAFASNPYHQVTLVALGLAASGLLAACETRDTVEAPPLQASAKAATLKPPEAPKKEVILSPSGDATTIPEPETMAASSLVISRQHGACVYHTKNSTLLDGAYNLVYSRVLPGSDTGPQFYTYLTTTGTFRQGLKEGEWYTLQLLDNLQNSREYYRHGLLHGDFELTNLRDSVQYKTTFTEGSGVWKSLYLDGKPCLVGAYIHGLRHGTWRRYSPAGQLLAETKYDHGQLLQTRSLH